MRGLTVAIVLSLALAGCFGGDDGPGPTKTSTSTSSTSTTTTSTAPPQPVEYPLLRDFGLDACDGARTTQRVDPAAVSALLPEGFTPATSSLAGVDPPQATIGVEAMHCTTFTASGSEFPDVWFGHVFTVVEEPTDRYPDRDLTADRHEYVFQLLAGEDILAQLWPVAGYDTHNGTGNQSVTDLVVAVSASTVLGGYTLGTQGAAQPSSLSGSFAWYTVLDGGDTLLWTGSQDLPFTHTGTGSADVPAGSPLSGMGSPVAADQLRGQGDLIAGGSWTGMDLVRIVEVA